MWKIKEIFKITSIPVLFASMCCLSPVILFIFGLWSVTFLGSLADTLYWDYKWYFRIFWLILLTTSLIIYFRKKWYCTLNKVKRNRNKIINTIILSVITFILGYMFFLYVVVHYIWVYFNLWE